MLDKYMKKEFCFYFSIDFEFLFKNCPNIKIDIKNQLIFFSKKDIPIIIDHLRKVINSKPHNLSKNKLISILKKNNSISKVQLDDISQRFDEPLKKEDKKEIEFHIKLLAKETLEDIKNAKRVKDVFAITQKKAYYSFLISFILQLFNNGYYLTNKESKNKNIIANYKKCISLMFVFHYQNFVYQNLKLYNKNYIEIIKNQRDYLKISPTQFNTNKNRVKDIKNIFKIVSREIFADLVEKLHEEYVWANNRRHKKQNDVFNYPKTVKDVYEASKENNNKVKKELKEISNLLENLEKIEKDKTFIGKLRKIRSEINFWSGK